MFLFHWDRKTNPMLNDLVGDYGKGGGNFFVYFSATATF